MPEEKSPEELAFLEAANRSPSKIDYWFDTTEINYLKSVLTPESVFLDIGAHIGTYSATIAPHVKSVYAFEPAWLPFSYLVTILARMQLKNVFALHMALGATVSIARFHETAIATHGSFGDTLEPYTHSHPSLVVTLDWLKEIGLIRRCDVMKLDTNGAEILAVQGGLGFIETFRPQIICKFDYKKDYGFGTKPHDIMALLPEYEWYRFGENGELILSRAGDEMPQHFNLLGKPKDH